MNKNLIRTLLFSGFIFFVVGCDACASQERIQVGHKEKIAKVGISNVYIADSDLDTRLIERKQKEISDPAKFQEWFEDYKKDQAVLLISRRVAEAFVVSQKDTIIANWNAIYQRDSEADRLKNIERQKKTAKVYEIIIPALIDVFEKGISADLAYNSLDSTIVKRIRWNTLVKSAQNPRIGYRKVIERLQNDIDRIKSGNYFASGFRSAEESLKVQGQLQGLLGMSLACFDPRDMRPYGRYAKKLESEGRFEIYDSAIRERFWEKFNPDAPAPDSPGSE